MNRRSFYVAMMLLLLGVIAGGFGCATTAERSLDKGERYKLVPEEGTSKIRTHREGNLNASTKPLSGAGQQCLIHTKSGQVLVREEGLYNGGGPPSPVLAVLYVRRSGCHQNRLVCVSSQRWSEAVHDTQNVQCNEI